MGITKAEATMAPRLAWERAIEKMGFDCLRSISCCGGEVL
jgi:hypothetical protein